MSLLAAMTFACDSMWRKRTDELTSVALYLTTLSSDRPAGTCSHTTHRSSRETGHCSTVAPGRDRGRPQGFEQIQSQCRRRRLAGIIREQGAAEVQTVGAGALNQAIKAIAIARGFVAPSGVELTCIPAFADIEINGEERTAIRLLVEPRDMHR